MLWNFNYMESDLSSFDTAMSSQTQLTIQTPLVSPGLSLADHSRICPQCVYIPKHGISKCIRPPITEPLAYPCRRFSQRSARLRILTVVHTNTSLRTVNTDFATLKDQRGGYAFEGSARRPCERRWRTSRRNINHRDLWAGYESSRLRGRIFRLRLSDWLESVKAFWDSGYGLILFPCPLITSLYYGM